MSKYTHEELIAIELKLEEEMKQSAADKFLKQQDKIAEGGSGSDTMAVNVHMKNIVKPLAEELESFMKGALAGRPGSNKTAAMQVSQILKLPRRIPQDIDLELLDIDYNRIALTIISTFFDSIMLDTTKLKSASYIINNIAAALEDEARYTMIELQKPGYFKKKVEEMYNNNSSYKNMRTNMIFSMHKFEENTGDIIFNDWNSREKKVIGNLALEIICNACEEYITVDYKRLKGKTYRYFSLSEDFLEWIKEFNESIAYHKKSLRPMVTKPGDWTKENSGGYLDIKSSFVKRRDSALDLSLDIDFIKAQVNKIQSTPWVVDTWMLEILLELSKGQDVINGKGDVIWYSSLDQDVAYRNPLLNSDDFDRENEEHMKILNEYKEQKLYVTRSNMKRASKFNSQHEAMSIANQYKEYDEIFFPHNVDFRYRAYPMSAVLNPQSSDEIKCMIKFADKQLLTEDGMWWLGVAVAGLAGYDKVSLDDRAVWAMENLERFRQTVADPIGNLDGWVDGDKPFQYLQAMREYVMANDAWVKGEEFYSQLPVQVDGKCNGLQHYTLISRDETVAPEVGLVPTAVPGDIYMRVADKTHEACQSMASTDELAKAWAEFGIPRKIAKRPTMTCVYGSGAFGFSSQIREELEKTNTRPEGDVFMLASFLGGTIDKNLESCIGRAGSAMAFLQLCVDIWCKYQKEAGSIDKKLSFRNPAGGIVSYNVLAKKDVVIKTRLYSKQIKIKDHEDDKSTLNNKSMINSICPNFVHSVDASHMYKTIDNSSSDISSYAMIHDSFGCHASSVDKLVHSLKVAAIDIHSDDLLDNFREDILADLPAEYDDILPPVPEKGDLDINDVMESDFFFS